MSSCCCLQTRLSLSLPSQLSNSLHIHFRRFCGLPLSPHLRHTLPHVPILALTSFFVQLGPITPPPSKNSHLNPHNLTPGTKDPLTLILQIRRSSHSHHQRSQTALSSQHRQHRECQIPPQTPHPSPFDGLTPGSFLVVIPPALGTPYIHTSHPTPPTSSAIRSPAATHPYSPPLETVISPPCHHGAASQPHNNSRISSFQIPATLPSTTPRHTIVIRRIRRRSACPTPPPTDLTWYSPWNVSRRPPVGPISVSGMVLVGVSRDIPFFGSLVHPLTSHTVFYRFFDRHSGGWAILDEAVRCKQVQKDACICCCCIIILRSRPVLMEICF